MAFNVRNLHLLLDGIGGGSAVRLFSYATADAEATISAADYFTDVARKGVRVGDFISVSSTHESATTGPIMTQVVAIDDDGNATVQPDDTDVDFKFALAGLTAKRSIRERFGDTINIREFQSADLPAIGTGDTLSDTTALNAAVAWCSSKSSIQRPSLMLGAVSLLVDNLEFNSVRSLRIIGESTFDAVYHRTEIKLSPDHTKSTALLRLTSCPNLDFEGIYFGINGQTGLAALIATDCNAASTSFPLNKYANNYIYWRHCVFDVPEAMVSGRPSVATVDLVSASNVEFDRCYFQGQIGLKLGAAEEIVGGTNTIPDGRCNAIYVHDSYIRGDIAMERLYGLKLERNQFYSNTAQPSKIPRIYAIGNYPTEPNANVSRDIEIAGNLCDPNANTGGLVSSLTGEWFRSGTNPESDNFFIHGNQITGVNTCFHIESGNAVIHGNRPIPLGTSTFRRFITRGAAANVRHFNNRREDWLSANSIDTDPDTDVETESINARMLYQISSAAADLPLPMLIRWKRDTDATISTTGVWFPLTERDFKFGGERVSFKYNICVRHQDAGTVVYQARFVVGKRVLFDGSSDVTISGAAVSGTESRATYSTTDGFFIMSGEHEAYIDATAQPVSIELQFQQVSGTPAIIQGNTLAGTTASVTILDY